MINRHRHGLTYSDIRSQDGIVEVEVRRLEVRGIGVSVDRIGGRKLCTPGLRDIQEVGRIDSASLEILEDRILIGHDTEHDLIEVRQALRGLVIVGVAHHGVVIAWYALTHHERTTGHRRIQVLARGQDLIGRHTAEDVRRHRGLEAIRPDREERREWR